MTRYFRITKNKGFELNLYFIDGDWFTFELSTRSKQDHAGVRFIFSLFFLFEFEFNFYDVRHWNYDKNRFYKEDENEWDLEVFNDDKPKYLNLQIFANSQEDKEALLNVSEYIHDFMVLNKQGKWEGLNSNFIGVNYLMHLYTSPDIIKINKFVEKSVKKETD